MIDIVLNHFSQSICNSFAGNWHSPHLTAQEIEALHYGVC